MSYKLSKQSVNGLFSKCLEEYRIFAPVRKEGQGRCSDTDVVMYDFVEDVSDIVFDQKSDYAFKEAFLPLSQTLFFFTENQVKEADKQEKKLMVFLRSCDMHAIKRLDEIYLNNGPEDYYYKRLRDNTVFVLMGCDHAFENCFCVDMETNTYEEYELAMGRLEDGYGVDCRNPKWGKRIAEYADGEAEFKPSFVTATDTRVTIPEDLSADVAKSSIWDEYDGRCINCGRCNFACPTCTCFTMQDIFYADNDKAGERRRVAASCMVDGFTDVAGGGAYRKENGQRMRFRVLHKVYDFKERFGYHMCVGCGRCDDICPEYITISGAINKLEAGMKEVKKGDA